MHLSRFAPRDDVSCLAADEIEISAGIVSRKASDDDNKNGKLALTSKRLSCNRELASYGQ